MLAYSQQRPNPRRTDIYYTAPFSQNLTIPSTQQQQWSQAASTIPSPPLSHYSDVTTAANDIYNFGADEPLFDFKPQQQYSPYNSRSSMQSEQNNSWLSNGQLTPTSTTTRGHHHRESSLSSLGSAGPASPYTANTSNPQVAGDIYHDYQDYQQSSSKPITPVHTPSQEQFLLPQYSNYYAHNLVGGYNMANDGLPKASSATALMPAPEFHGHSGRPSISTVASHDSPSSPPSYEEQRSKHGETLSSAEFWLNEYLQLDKAGSYRQAPKLDRTMTDVFEDELYNPNFQLSAPTCTTPAVTATLSPQNEIFMQRLNAANSQHLSASGSQIPLTIPARDTSPFRMGSPLAPVGNTFGHGFGSASSMRERQKLESDEQALREQMRRTSPEQHTPKTISPKDVSLEYHDSEEDTKMPLFPPQQQTPQISQVMYRQQPAMKQEAELDDTSSQQSYNSMATSRPPASPAYSTSSQQQGNFQFTPPSVPGSVQRLPQQYPFVPATRRQPSNLSSVEQFTPALSSMESSSSEYTETESKKPAGVLADTGTYTCTYHGCTLRFETPAKLQRHKREGHRNSASAASAIASGDDSGMTSVALRNTQNGPHKCERINPSTGKPCNTIFSRPYDLTRHEDTIHNARKQKVRCHLCVNEEKTFSRSDALTRHFRYVHFP